MARTPNVNASLIHEIRMWMQALGVAGALRGVSLSGGGGKNLCVVCIKRNRDKPNKAVAMQQGSSVCREHVY